MKNLIIAFIFFINLQTAFAQKIGIVSNINLDLDYVHLEGILKLKPKNPQKIDYNFDNFIDNYFKNKGLKAIHLNDFDFNLFAKNHDYRTPKQNKIINNYVEQYCLENNLQKLLIIRKPTEIDLTKAVAGFKDVDSDFFIYTSDLARKKAGIVYRTEITLFNPSKNNLFSSFGAGWRIYNFKKYIVDKEDNITNSNEIESTMIKVFEDFIIKYFENILN